MLWYGSEIKLVMSENAQILSTCQNERTGKKYPHIEFKVRLRMKFEKISFQIVMHDL